ncbi:phloretin 4'-O-glucosyltransferase-like [Telopea speciosissima]|uniref:phloretin 4'-O-glucosyltransferase-like n=1 Tax=Telopea speciosissima TaxID=54955 RepID=UPI001CC805E1|nr:phloretin 4'-O-glucosyltransferase-like [Telopea speciosissima]
MDHRKSHFLLVTFTSQGHLNPILQLAKRLIRTTGTKVTLATTVKGQRLMTNTDTNTLPLIPGLSFAFFSDGFDDGSNPSDDPNHIAAQMKRVGSQSFSNLINSFNEGPHPVTFVVYSILLPWVADVARAMHIPSALLWISSATVFALYYHFFNGHDRLIETSTFIDELPGLPPLTRPDLPSFFQPSSPHTFVLPIIHEHFQTLQQDSHPRVLLNTFDALEESALRALSKLNVIEIGPLTPSEDKAYGCDLFSNKTGLDYIEWLNSKPVGSVVYVSFGSLVVLPNKQIEEIFHGLKASQKPFLWVVRSSESEIKELELEEETEGMIVGWCSQVEVLNHRSVGCFVTHCGWNSTVESLVTGVPVVGCPHFSDQPTNAKMIEAVFGTGVRARVSEEGEGIVEREELKRCLNMVMGGENGEEMRRNALKWKDLAMEAVGKGCSSARNFRAFVEELVQGCDTSIE